MSLGLVEIECTYILRNTDRLKEENGVLSLKKNHMPIISNAAGSNWIEVVRFCCVDFCGVTICRLYFNQELWVPVEKNF